MTRKGRNDIHTRVISKERSDEKSFNHLVSFRRSVKIVIPNRRRRVRNLEPLKTRFLTYVRNDMVGGRNDKRTRFLPSGEMTRKGRVGITYTPVSFRRSVKIVIPNRRRRVRNLEPLKTRFLTCVRNDMVGVRNDKVGGRNDRGTGERTARDG